MLSLPATEAPAAAGDAVVDIAALDAHLARRSGEVPAEPAGAAVRRRCSPSAGRRRRAAAGRGPAGRRASRRTPPSAAQEDAVVDMDAVDSWFSRSREREGG